MKTLVAFLLIIVLLAAGGAALAQSEMSVGGNYQLTSLPLHPAQGNGWQVSGSASGGGYALAALYQPELRGSGCCCTYLPCVLRSFP